MQLPWSYSELHWHEGSHAHVELSEPMHFIKANALKLFTCELLLTSLTVQDMPSASQPQAPLAQTWPKSSHSW
jgi:hypothetical protein